MEYQIGVVRQAAYALTRLLTAGTDKIVLEDDLTNMVIIDTDAYNPVRLLYMLKMFQVP